MYFASHQAIQPFALARPGTVEEAVAAGASGAETAFLSGGVDLIPALRLGQRPDTVIWLKDIPGLADIRREGDTLVVNAPNCVDCKATDVLGPRWAPREGGSGPAYKRM